MAVITPPSITPAPTPAPQRNDRTTFSSRVDAFVTWLITAVTEFGAVATNVALNATDAATSASTASTQAANASNSAGTATTKASEAAASAVLAANLTEAYQGALGSDPTLDRHGNALTAGDWYTNSTTGFIRAYTGSAWVNGLTAIAGVTSINGYTGVVTGIVDLSTAQTLSNKTLSAATNNVEARSLKSATTTVDVSSAAAPTAGQVLTATSGTAATWQTVGTGTGTLTDVKASRAASTTYTNSGATTRWVLATGNCSPSVWASFVATVGGVERTYNATTSGTTGSTLPVIFPVPPGATYSIAINNCTIFHWHEFQ